MAITDDPAVALCFTVTIDKHEELGPFTSCDGLGCDLTVEQREEGGNNGFVHQLPGRLKYSNIKLTRPITDKSSKVAAFVSKMATTPTRTQITIQARTADGTVVCGWELNKAFPVKWTGPQLNTENAKVATETLEIAHHGFIG
jgi:phage tail-like protein